MAKTNSRGVARARGKRACCASSPHRTRAVAALLRTCASRQCARLRPARGTTALDRTRKPCHQRGGLIEPKGQNQPARRRARARQMRVLRLLSTKSACVGRSLAHMRKPAVRVTKNDASHHGLASNKKALSTARRPSRVGWPKPTRAAWRARAANALAAPPPHTERVRWPLSCAHARACRARGQGQRVAPRPCIEQESPVASAAAFLSRRAKTNSRGVARARGKRACCASSPH